jgi:3-methylcrotonyl-CoA carboxylase alpha subunit
MLPRSVLVANRGEIAVRVERTCRRLGIRTVAVYSDADAGALHVALADAAVRIGPPAPAESYLRIDAILDAAAREGAEAVHPGYGFLAENPDFAQACLDAGLVWVGPSPDAMRRLGDKALARALAQEQGVPVLPGLALDDVDPRTLTERASALGLPLLIKASAGGGGRGMRLVRSVDELDAQLEAARREALTSFGDDRLLFERYVPHARHIEAQLLGDTSGGLFVLGERECSIQRRNQKLLEETPSPAVDPALRARLVQAARTLGQAVGYTSAGTVEFVLDQQGEFAFLEVNTRLQVEHPVTELVAGLDLVELQLRIAAGESLPPELADLVPTGHAIEARIVAEDPLLGFVPSTGRIEAFDMPADVRVDSGVRVGDGVSTAYDSLLAKVIVGGRDRAEAVDGLADALRQCRVRGVRTNLDLLLAVVETPAFRAGDLETGFLQEQHVVEGLDVLPTEAVAVAAAADFFVPPASDDPWQQSRPWRLGREGQPSRWRLGSQERLARVTFEPDSSRPRITVAAATHEVSWLGSGGPGVGQLHVDGRLATVRDLVGQRQVGWLGRTYRLERERPPSVEAAGRGSGRGGNASGVLSAPMPGRVLSLSVAVGDSVAAGQTLAVLEAMKMEHAIEAPHAGVVKRVDVAVHQQVARGEPLLELEGEPV